MTSSELHHQLRELQNGDRSSVAVSALKVLHVISTALLRVLRIIDSACFALFSSREELWIKQEFPEIYSTQERKRIANAIRFNRRLNLIDSICPSAVLIEVEERNMVQSDEEVILLLFATPFLKIEERLLGKLNQDTRIITYNDRMKMQSLFEGDFPSKKRYLCILPRRVGFMKMRFTIDALPVKNDSSDKAVLEVYSLWVNDNLAQVR